jgi:hypothetical protein
MGRSCQERLTEALERTLLICCVLGALLGSIERGILDRTGCQVKKGDF